MVTTKGKPIPKSLQIVPVYDSPDIMHVKVPWAGDLTPAPKKIKYCDEEEDYNEFLAEYFIRKCR